MNNIYLCEYQHFCGKESAVIIAKDKKEALQLFKEYEKMVSDYTTVVKLGIASVGKKSKIIMTASE